MIVRLLNYAFYFVIILVFILAAGPFDKFQIIFAFILSAIVSYISFIFKWLSLDGKRAATVIGTVTLGFGGWEFTVYLLIFFMSSNFIGSFLDSPTHRAELKLSERRKAEQVWANGFWFVSLLLVWFLTGFSTAYVAAVTALAVATSDTWATLIGSYASDRKVWLISDFKRVSVGTDGGISIAGTFSALMGSGLVALTVFFFEPAYVFFAALTIFICGFAGCLADSYLGSYFQHKERKIKIGSLEFKPGNNAVNWASAGFGCALSVLIFNIITYALV